MKDENTKAPNFKDMELYNFDMIHEATSKLYNDLSNQLENIIIEGLKRKGFEFNNRLELERFVKEHCRCEDDIILKERVYYVDNIPFFLHDYNTEIDARPIIEDRAVKMGASLGSFAYL